MLDSLLMLLYETSYMIGVALRYVVIIAIVGWVIVKLVKRKKA